MEKYIKIKNKKLGTTNEPRAPYLDLEGNYCNLKVSTIEDYDIYFDKVYYKENNIIIIPKRDFTYTDPSTGTIYSGLYQYSWRNFGNKNSGFNAKAYPECMVEEDPTTFLRDNGGHIIRGMYKLPQPYLDELTNIKPIGSAQHAFSSLYCLTTLNGVEKTWDTSEITDMHGMFRELGCNSPDASTNSSDQDYYPWSKYQPGTLDLSGWDFSNVTDVEYMFCGTRFKVISNKPIDLKNLSSICDMFKAYNYKNIPELITTNVTSMEDAFSSSAITNIPKLDTHNVTNMKSMFWRCYNLPFKFPWVIDCSSITSGNDMSYMFYNTLVKEVYLYNVKEDIRNQITSSKLKSDNTLTIHFVDSLDIDIDNTIKLTDSNHRMDKIFTIKGEINNTYIADNFLDTSMLTSGDYMFYNCKNLREIPELDTSNIINMQSMFASCTSLKSIPKLNTSKVTNMAGIFGSCTNLTYVPQLDTNNVENMLAMFSRCTHLESVPELNTSKVTNMERMFCQCNSLTTVSLSDTSKVENMNEMFNECKNLTSVSELDISNCANMAYMFENCEKVDNIILKSTNEENVPNEKNMNAMFAGCKSLKEIKVDMKNVINASSMFSRCSSLTSVQLTNTNKLIKAPYMFSGCSSLTNVPEMDISNATEMNYMFNGCSSLTDIPELNTSKATNMAGMFYGCTSLPKEFPWAIDCSSITSEGYLFNMFAYSSVTKIKLKNIKSSFRSKVTSSYLKGDNTLEIEFIN